ncbi:hypothetical protein ACNRWW_13905 [Metabacillus sp. HB246100]
MSKEKMIEEYIVAQSPNDAMSHINTFCYVKVMYEATQAQYAKYAGISDRGLRSFISSNKEEYEQELERVQAEKDAESDVDFSQLNTRVLSEEQIDKFVENVFKKATSPNASVREWEFFLNFTGLTATEVLNLQEAKAKTLRYWIKAQMPLLKQFMDTKVLGLMTETSRIIYRGNKDSKDNAQAFIDADIHDEAFAKELMYWGAVHLSMMNNVEHPDIELLATSVRLDRIEQGIAETFNKYEVKRYAEGDFTPKKSNKTMNELMLELCILEHGITRGTEEFEKLKEQRDRALAVAVKTVKPPVTDKVDINARASKYEDELRVLLTAEEEMRHMMNEITKKVNKQKGARY